jgi:hypothetical protein
MNIYKELAKFKHIKYYDEPHKYFIGEQELVSGTTFIGKYKEKFDSEKMAEKTAAKKKISIEEVLADWAFKGDFSRSKGTLLHNYAENYWFNKVFPVDMGPFDERFGEGLMLERYEACKTLFEAFYNDACESLIPIAAELVIGDEEIGIAGMVDKLFWNQKMGELQIWDYKTNKEINSFSKFRKKMLHPIAFLPECELVTYSIQTSLYKYIIEKNTNLKLGRSYLVHIHEENERYNIIECTDYTDVVKLMIKHYRDESRI